MADIAFCGIGLMGSQMALRLARAGHSVRAWNRTAAKARAWAKDSGGTASATPGEAARGAAELHMMLSSDDAVEHVLFEADGALTTLPKGALVVDHSTVSTITVDARADRVAQGGWRYLHAPVFAGPANVGKGEGLMLIGGPAVVYASAKPTLSQIIESHWHVGERPSAAAAFKLMGNSMLFTITQALAEFFSLGKACGIEPETALTLFDRFDPGRTIFIRGSRMAHGDYAPAFQISMAAKDAGLMIGSARHGGADMPVLELVLQRMLRLIKSGHGDLDLAALGLAEVHAMAAHPNGAETVKTGDG